MREAIAEKSGERILVMAHGHPDFSLGGGEIAAYNLFKAYRNSSEVADAWFLARADRGRGATGQISLRRENEYLWEQGVSDWHLMKAANRDALWSYFSDLLRALKPTVVHVHHYVHMGLEFLRIIKMIDPNIRIYMTLHEFIAICKNNGQMIKTNGRLCSSESLDDCRSCFPSLSSEDFWLRKQFYLRHFDVIDGFVSPSEFLRQRYISWGLDADRIVVIENGQAAVEVQEPRSLASGESRNRFGFFGQITPYKGVDVVLSALAQMKKSERSRLVLEVHGANLDQQPEAYKEKVVALRDPLVKEGCVQWVGPYQPHEIRKRMEAVDWVVVPSIWWENSPMVIQEAFTYGKPLLVSDIGGMAEKVRDGIDGIHVQAGNSVDWKRRLLQAAEGDAAWKTLQAGIVPPLTYEGCAVTHLDIFRRWCAGE